jgi:hypothetical protein
MAKVKDPETVALAKCLQALETLDETARQRVLKYLRDRFDPLTKPAPEAGQK